MPSVRNYWSDIGAIYSLCYVPMLRNMCWSVFLPIFNPDRVLILNFSYATHLNIYKKAPHKKCKALLSLLEDQLGHFQLFLDIGYIPLKFLIGIDQIFNRLASVDDCGMVAAAEEMTY